LAGIATSCGFPALYQGTLSAVIRDAFDVPVYDVSSLVE
jgi:hypothetical protein